MAGADPPHGYDMQHGAGGGELLGHGRGGGHGDVDRPTCGHELAGHAEQGLVRATPLGYRLDTQDGEGVVGSGGPAVPAS